MSGVEIEIEGAEYAGQVFDRLISKGKNLTPLMDAIGAAMVSSTEERITTEKRSPSGKKWPSLSKAYEKRKPDSEPGGILVREGLLYGSIAVGDVDNDSVEWGAGVEYAAIHQFGGNFKAFGKHDAVMPARPFLGISRRDRDVIMDLCEAYIDV